MNDTVIARIVDAIAFAEGYSIPGSRPHRNNNPGDLERDPTGKGIGHDGPYVIYASAEDGREALEHQVRLMFGGSHIYKPSMTIAEVAEHYASTDQAAWGKNVAAYLGVPPATRLNQIA
jgi:hypothetical protein